jgi:quercetin dioxygenase-like cupin family protein
MTDIWFLHNRVRIPISGAATDGAFALLEVSGPPGDQPPLHVHHDHDEGFYVLEGELTIWVGDAVHVLRPGDAMLAPRGVPHTVRAGDRGGRWLVTSTPAGFEAFVRSVGSPDPSAAVPDPSELTRIAAEHGIEILGPPGMLPGELEARAA